MGRGKETIWHSTDVRSKFRNISETKLIKILPGPKQCARDVTN